MKKWYTLAFVCCFGLTAFGQWVNDPLVNTLVANTGSDESPVKSITDGAGGSIIFFLKGDDTIAAQRITVSGSIVWGDTQNPVILSTKFGSSALYYLNAISDGNGGAFVGWEGYSDVDDNIDSGFILLQHINSFGVQLWGVNGKNVSISSSGSDNWQTICTDGAGGIIVGWRNYNKAAHYLQMQAQRFNSSGVAQWGVGGVQVCTASGFRAGVLAPDGSGGAIAVFYDYRNDPHGTDFEFLDTLTTDYELNSDIYAQRLNANGQPQWGSSGVTVCTADRSQSILPVFTSPIVSDGSGGVIVQFQDTRNSTLDSVGQETNTEIYAQRINASGVALWATNGVPVYNHMGFYPYLKTFEPDGTGGAVVLNYYNAETNLSTPNRLAASNGARLWGDDGKVLVSPPEGYLSFVSSIAAATDGLGNTLFDIYYNYYTPEFVWVYKRYAQKLNAAGIEQWGEGVTFSNIALSGVVTASTNGDAIFAWLENRAGENETNSDIYASKILSNGTLAGSAQSVPYFSAGNGNWSSPATWVGGVVPPLGADVTIRHAVTINVNVSCNSIKVEQPAGYVKVNSGILVNVTH